MSSDTLREALEKLTAAVNKYAGVNGLGPHYMMIALTQAEAALSLPAEGPHEPMCDVFGKRCERCFPAKPETVAAPAQLGSCHRCDALWERNPAKMKHRHPEGTQFIYPCDAPPALLREGQETAREVARTILRAHEDTMDHLQRQNFERVVDILQQVVKQARVEDEEAASKCLKDMGLPNLAAQVQQAIRALADLREKG